VEATLESLEKCLKMSEDRQRRLNAYVANTAGIYREPERLRTETYRLFVRIDSSELRANGTVYVPEMTRVDEIVAAREIVESLFTIDDYGNEVFDEDRVALMIAKGQEYLTEVEWLALVRLFDDPRMTLERIADVSSIAILKSGSSLNSVPPNARETLYKLGSLITQRLQNETNILLMRGGEFSDQEYARLESLLQRSLLFTFISELTSHCVFVAGSFSENFDFSQFSNGTLYFIQSTSFGVSGFVPFATSTLDDFLGRTSYLSNRYRMNSIRALADAEANAPNWTDFGVSTLKSLSMSKGAGTSFNLLNTIVQMEQYGITLNNAQISHLDAMTMLAFYDLGGGMAGIQTPNGYRFTAGNTNTPQAMINLAGLGLSELEATAVLADTSNSERETVAAFVAPQGGWHGFANELLGVYQENFEAITAQFPSLNLEYTTRPDNLPLPVLQEIINMHGGGNG